MKLDERLRTQAEYIRPDEVLVERTIRRMESVSGQTPQKTGRRTAPRLAPVLAALLLFAAVGGGAAYASGLLPRTAEALGLRFGTREEQTALIGQMAESAAASCVRGGICVSATAELLDRKIVVVQIEVSRENGEPLVPAETEGFDGIFFGASGFSTDGLFYFGRPDRGRPEFPAYRPGDATACGYLYLQKTNDDEVGELDLYLNSLTAGYTDRSEDIAAAETELEKTDGVSWDLNIPIHTSAEGRTLAADAEFRANGHTFRIDGIHISPVAVLAEYTVISTTISENAVFGYYTMENGDRRRQCIDLNEKPFWENIDLALRLKDGRVIDMSAWTMDAPDGPIVNQIGYTETDDARDLYILHRGDVLPEAIPYEEMDCVILNGAEYLVN